MARERFGEESDPFRHEPSGAVTALAVFDFVLGGLVLVAGVFAFIGIAALSGEVGLFHVQPIAVRRPWNAPPPPVPADIPAAMGLAIAMCLGIILWGVGAIIAGIGVMKRHQWGRILTLVLGAFAALVALLFIWAGVQVLSDDGGAPGGIPAPPNFGIALLLFFIGLIHLGYTIYAYGILLNPHYAAEFN